MLPQINRKDKVFKTIFSEILFLFAVILIFHQKINFFFIHYSTFSSIHSYSSFEFIETKYFKSWNNYEITEYLTDPKISFKNCPHCNFEPVVDQPSSKHNDILLSSMFGNIANLVPSCRSLRTTGCKAAFFVLTENSTYSLMTQDTIDLIKQCGLYVINLGVCEKLSPRVFFALRHLIYYNFLTPIRHLINRIILMDLYDTIFQGDPFPEYFRSETLYFCSENLTFAKSRGNRKWLRTIVHDDLLKYYPLHIVNGGTILGSADLIIKYLELFMVYVNMSRLVTLKADDQAYTNFFAYSGILEKHQVKHKIFDLSDFIVCVHGMQYFPGEWYLGKYMTPIAKKRHLVVHQFDRSRMMKFNVYISCPKMNYNISSYMRGITSTEFEILDDFVNNGSFYYETFKNINYFED